jgi:hypothetical protein
MQRVIITIEMDADRLFMGRPGRAGLSFDTGETGEEMTLAIDDLAEELKKIYKHELKGKAQA